MSKVELMTVTSQNEVSTLDVENMIFNGRSLSEIFSENDEDLCSLTELDESIASSNLSYIGFLPSTKHFVVGFDCWLEDDEEGACANVFEIDLSGKKLEVVSYKRTERMIYSGGKLGSFSSNFEGMINVMLS